MVQQARTSTTEKPKLGHDPFLISIDKIQPSPENDKLYRPVDPDDPETVSLAESIRKFGIREPLVLTLDGHILSGHRRFAAARLAGLEDYQRELIEMPLSPQEQFLKEFSGEVSAGQTPAARLLKRVFSGLGAAVGSGVGGGVMSPAGVASLTHFMAPFKDSLAFLTGMNDPTYLYLHFTACVAP